MYLTVADLKRHLNVDFSDDDAYIAELEKVAESYIETYLQRPLSELTTTDGCPHASLNASVRHAIRLMVGQLYANREPVSFAAPSEIPFGLRALLLPLKKFAVYPENK